MGAAIGAMPGRVTVRTVASGRNSRYTDGMPREKNPNHLTSREAAAILGVTVPRFYEMVNQGVIRKHYKAFAKRPHFDRQEIETLRDEEYRRANTRASEPEGPTR